MQFPVLASSAKSHLEWEIENNTVHDRARRLIVDVLSVSSLKIVVGGSDLTGCAPLRALPAAPSPATTIPRSTLLKRMLRSGIAILSSISRSQISQLRRIG
jgi:hypothetical protein